MSSATSSPSLANRRAQWEARGTSACPRWVEGVDDVLARVERFLPSLLRCLDLVCPQCKAKGGSTAQGASVDRCKYTATGVDVAAAAPLCDRASVRFLTAGSFNRAFLVVPCGDTSEDGHVSELIFRVALPLITRFSKVAAEVATMEWVRRNTEIPLPDVLAYAIDGKNDVGYEW